MQRQRPVHTTPNGNRQSGGTLLGFIIGLVLGLAIAVAVALFITKAPIPFINKVLRAPDHVEPEPSKLPDPNKPLYPKDALKNGDQAPTPAANPGYPPGIAPAQPQQQQQQPQSQQPPAATQSDGKGAPVIDKSSGPRTDLPDGKQALLQIGAYKTADDAENMKAKLALLGFEAKVSSTERDGTSLFRVRLGPYGRLDDLNRVRQRLAEAGVDASVIPIGK